MIKDIKKKLFKIGMEENNVYEIIELLYSDDNLIREMFPKGTTEEIAMKQFEYLVEEFSKIEYDFDIKNIILNDSPSIGDLLYNYMIFRLKYDFKLLGGRNRRGNKFLSDLIRLVVTYIDLDLDNKEEYYIFTFNKNMSIEKVNYP